MFIFIQQQEEEERKSSQNQIIEMIKVWQPVAGLIYEHIWMQCEDADQQPNGGISRSISKRKASSKTKSFAELSLFQRPVYDAILQTDPNTPHKKAKLTSPQSEDDDTESRSAASSFHDDWPAGPPAPWRVGDESSACWMR